MINGRFTVINVKVKKNTDSQSILCFDEKKKKKNMESSSTRRKKTILKKNYK